MKFLAIRELLLIANIIHYGIDGYLASEMGDDMKSKVLKDEPKDGDEWMLHTPGGGPLDSRCPCLHSDICPRAFGHSPTDVLLLGHLPICMEESKVRCCGASFSVIIGSESVKVNDTPTDNDISTEQTKTFHNVITKVTGNSNVNGASEMVPSLFVDSARDTSKNLSVNVNATEKSPTVDTFQDAEIVTKEYTYQNNSGDVMNDAASSTRERITDNKNSNMAYTENLKFAMPLFQDRNAKGTIQKSKDGDIMVVTPIPLTSRTKYQQVGTEGNSQLPLEIDSLHLLMKEIMHMTHQPESEVMVVTPLPIEETKLAKQWTLPPVTVSSTEVHPSPHKEQLVAEHNFQPLGQLRNIIQVDGFMADDEPQSSNGMKVEEQREKHLTGAASIFSPVLYDGVTQNTPIITQESTINPMGFNRAHLLQENQKIMPIMHEIQNFRNPLQHSEREIGISQITEQNMERPPRVVNTPTWSPKRLTSRKPGQTFHQRSQVGSNKQSLHLENMANNSTGKVTRGNLNTNPILQDFRSSMPIKYVPIPMNKVVELRMQHIMNSPGQIKMSNTVTNRHNIPTFSQSFPNHEIGKENSKEEVSGTQMAVNRKFPGRGMTAQKIFSNQQTELDLLQNKLPSVQASLPQWVAENSKEPNDDSLRNTGSIQSSQKSKNPVNSNINKNEEDEVFGRRIISPQPYLHQAGH